MHRRPQQVLDVSNEVAAELAGVEDGVLDALRERLQCTIALRGAVRLVQPAGSST